MSDGKKDAYERMLAEDIERVRAAAQEALAKETALHHMVGVPSPEDAPPRTNSRQVGGDHYQHQRVSGENLQHWDICWQLGFDQFQYCITKYVFRHKFKNRLEDLRKAQHHLEKYIELYTEMEAQCPIKVNTTADVQEVRERMLGDGEVMPVEAFTYEGGTSTEDRWRCKTCHTHFNSGVGQAPGRVHGCAPGKMAYGIP